MINNIFSIYLPSLLIFIAIWRSVSLFNKNKLKEGIYSFALIGFLPWTLIAAFRHMFLPGHIIQKQNPFFEFEAGGASLAVAIATIFTLINPNPNQFLIIFIIYLFYLIFALLAWLLFNKNTKLFNILRFISIILVMIYYVFMSYKSTLSNL